MKPATALPINRHFDCMKKCPIDCGAVCKRLAYPKLVEALRELATRCDGEEGVRADGSNIQTMQAWGILRELGEAE